MAVLDRIPVDRIALEASTLRLSKVALSAVAAPFFVAGWVAAKLWRSARWTIAAVIVGFQAGNARAG